MGLNLMSLNFQPAVSLPVVSAQPPDPTRPGRKPPWLKVKLPGGHGYTRLRAIVDENRLHTVCESARCPNLGECWGRGTATVMILGDVCTRSCGFCHIATGRPPVLDLDEPRRVAQAAAKLNLKHMVITSVNRDELADGGSTIWADTISAVRQASPTTRIEVLIPDFCGHWVDLERVLAAKPDILNHNMETVASQYQRVRPQAKYARSLELLRRAKDQGFTTKTGLMLGIGEQPDELLQALKDIRAARVDILTLGQYLQPTRDHLPIDRWVTPEEFAHWKTLGLELGFTVVESGPLVRSSYHADEQASSTHF
ncbi:MAG: lipoyl synthase [Phycisphaerae bacterium]|nr:lipoyl synthase [Phycisphaerae bacterium]